MIESFNKDQLDGLAKLCFDLAKAAFILAILAPFSQTVIVAAISGFRSYLVGTYLVTRKSS